MHLDPKKGNKPAACLHYQNASISEDPITLLQHLSNLYCKLDPIFLTGLSYVRGWPTPRAQCPVLTDWMTAVNQFYSSINQNQGNCYKSSTKPRMEVQVLFTLHSTNIHSPDPENLFLIPFSLNGSVSPSEKYPVFCSFMISMACYSHQLASWLPTRKRCSSSMLVTLGITDCLKVKDWN